MVEWNYVPALDAPLVFYARARRARVARLMLSNSSHLQPMGRRGLKRDLLTQVALACPDRAAALIASAAVLLSAALLLCQAALAEEARGAGRAT